MRIYYHQSSYISHCKAASDYIECLHSLGHTIESSPKDAELAIIHDEPIYYDAILRNNPDIAKLPLAAYAVWETDILPQAYVDAIKKMQSMSKLSIWTCSDYSRAAFLPHFPQTELLPHVVKRLKPSVQDLDWCRNFITESAEAKQTGENKIKQPPYLFYTITDSINPRKNLTTLLEVFCTLSPALNPNIFLLVKQGRHRLDLSSLRNVISLDESLTEGQISALHAICHCYVSPHHSEAWGLSLTEAMGMGKTVIATGYSGNMQFMNEKNSIPVKYQLVNVPAEATEKLPLLTTDMHWADIDKNHLAACIKKQAGHPTPYTLIAEESRMMALFSQKAISEIMETLLIKAVA